MLISNVTGYPYTTLLTSATSNLMQTIGMAIQRGNSSCILETVFDSRKLDEVYYSGTFFIMNIEHTLVFFRYLGKFLSSNKSNTYYFKGFLKKSSAQHAQSAVSR